MPVDRRASVVRFALWGRILVAYFVLALAIGGATVQIFFPDRIGAGASPGMLIVLVLIWSVGAIGALLCVIAWIMFPRLTPQLMLNYPRNADGRYFTTFTRVVACLTLSVACFGSLLIALSPQETAPLWKRLVTVYLPLCVWAFTIHLAFLYTPKRHPATTTLLNLLGPFFAYALFPLLWPLLLYLNSNSREHQAS